MWTKFCLDHVPKGSTVEALKLLPDSNKFIQGDMFFLEW